MKRSINLKVFFSHAWADKTSANVKILMNELKSKGYEVWIDRYEIGLGEDIDEKVISGIKECDVFILAWSENASKNKNVLEEIKFAKKYKKPIIPCIIDGFPIEQSKLIGRLKWIAISGNSKFDIPQLAFLDNYLIDFRIKKLGTDSSDPEIQKEIDILKSTQTNLNSLFREIEDIHYRQKIGASGNEGSDTFVSSALQSALELMEGKSNKMTEFLKLMMEASKKYPGPENNDKKNELLFTALNELDPEGKDAYWQDFIKGGFSMFSQMQNGQPLESADPEIDETNDRELAILWKAKEEKATFVDLGNCGLDKLPEGLFDDYFIKHLEGLSLGDFYHDINGESLDSSNSGRPNNLNDEELIKLSQLKNLTRFFFSVYANSPNKLTSMEFASSLNQLKILFLNNHQISKIEILNKNLQTLNLNKNQINKIENLNHHLKELHLGWNKIKKIENLNENLKTLVLFNNQLDRISNLAKGLQTLDIGANQISKIENLNENLKTLSLTFSQITKIENLNKNLQTLEIGNNQITKIENLNKNLKNLYLNENQITKIENLNKNLKNLYLNENQISKIENLNENLLKLDLSINQISKIENLNENLQSLNLMNNKINKIENLNKNLQILDLRNNKILQIENLNEKLQAIDLGKNKIENLKPIVEFIRGKKTNFCIVANDYLCLDEYQINVYSNPLINPPMKIVEEGTAAILRYFEE